MAEAKNNDFPTADACRLTRMGKVISIHKRHWTGQIIQFRTSFMKRAKSTLWWFPSMLTRIGNLVLASLFLLLVLFVALAMNWPDNWGLLSPPPHPLVEPRPFYNPVVAWTICVSVIWIWVISAAFLFVRRRFAWFGSLLGVGSAICLLMGILIEAVWEGFFSSRTEEYSSFAAYAIGMIFGFGFLIGWLTFSIAVFIGLIKNRRELV